MFRSMGVDQLKYNSSIFVTAKIELLRLLYCVRFIVSDGFLAEAPNPNADFLILFAGTFL